MEVRVIHERPNGLQAEMGLMQLNHMPPVGEPFPVNEVAYTAKAYFGPDGNGRYLLVLAGEPMPVEGH